MEIKDLLNELYEEKARLQVFEMKKEELIDSVIPEEVKKKIQDIKDEIQPSIEIALGLIEDLEKEIKLLVQEKGVTVRGDYLMAVYSKPRVRWDEKGLDGYSIAHPEVLAFRSEGKPSASIRVIQ